MNRERVVYFDDHDYRARIISVSGRKPYRAVIQRRWSRFSFELYRTRRFRTEARAIEWATKKLDRFERLEHERSGGEVMKETT